MPLTVSLMLFQSLVAVLFHLPEYLKPVHISSEPLFLTDLEPAKADQLYRLPAYFEK